MVDLKTEYVWGASMNAAKRDVGATIETDMVHDAFNAFVWGRELIAAADGDLSEDELSELEGYATIAIGNWEMAIAATVIHYINDVLADMALATSESEDTFSLEDYAKHWGEAKGFGLWFNSTRTVR